MDLDLFEEDVEGEKITLPNDWNEAVGEELAKPYFRKLQQFLAEERARHVVYPPESDVFNALKFSPYAKTNVLLLGQDPYHNAGQAHGLCFSVLPGIETPPSLVNIYKELNADVGVPTPKTGYLAHWAEQGILMLNAVLTVRAHTPTSHAKHGWETFTDAIIKKVSAKNELVVFVLWGAYAQKKIALIDTARHTIVQSVHPSPLSARNGFFGSKPFSQINTALEANGKPPIDWQIPTPPVGS